MSSATQAPCQDTIASLTVLIRIGIYAVRGTPAGWLAPAHMDPELAQRIIGVRRVGSAHRMNAGAPAGTFVGWVERSDTHLAGSATRTVFATRTLRLLPTA